MRAVRPRHVNAGCELRPHRGYTWRVWWPHTSQKGIKIKQIQITLHLRLNSGIQIVFVINDFRGYALVDVDSSRTVLISLELKPFAAGCCTPQMP